MADDILGGGGAPEGGGGGEAFAFLPDGLQSLAEGYDKPETFWADVSRLKGMDSELKALKGVSPDSLATDEDFDKAFKALGRPDDKSGYRLPEAWDGEVWTPDGKMGVKADEAVKTEVNRLLAGDAEQFRDIAHRCNLTEKQAGALYTLWGSVVARGVSAQQAARAENTPEKAMTELWPRDTLAHQETATRGAASLGLVDALNDSGLAGNPLVLKLCHALGEAVGEDRVAGLSGGGAALPTGEAAREELRRVVASDAYRNLDERALKTAEALASRVSMK